MDEWSVYLGGEIHSDWRRQILKLAQKADLPAMFAGPVTDHALSDNCGIDILGPEDSPFWKDHKGAKLNAIRTRTQIENADLVVIRFAGEYREWNAAFDAGYAAALNKPLITIHDEKLDHALKEVDAAALAVARTPEQVVEIMRYVIL
jgi:YtoQ family protein